MTNVVQICESGALAPSSFLARRNDAVLCDQLPINGSRVFASGNATGHIEPVPMPKVLHGHLLNQSLDRSRFTTILHTAKNYVPRNGTFTATPKRDCLRHNPKANSTSLLREQGIACRLKAKS